MQRSWIIKWHIKYKYITMYSSTILELMYWATIHHCWLPVNYVSQLLWLTVQLQRCGWCSETTACMQWGFCFSENGTGALKSWLPFHTSTSEKISLPFASGGGSFSQIYQGQFIIYSHSSHIGKIMHIGYCESKKLLDKLHWIMKLCGLTHVDVRLFYYVHNN